MNRIETKEKWQSHLERWSKSGLSKKAYCTQNALSYWNFRTWIGRLKSQSENPAGKLVRIDTAVVTNSVADRIEVRCGENVRIFIDGSTTPERLAGIVNALEKRHA